MGGDGLGRPNGGREDGFLLLSSSFGGPLLRDISGEGDFLSGKYWSGFVLGA